MFVYTLALPYLISFNPIINNIFWVKLNINILNIVVDTINIKIVIYLLTSLFLIHFNTILITLFILNTLTGSTYFTAIVISYFTRLKSSIKLLHLLTLVTFSVPMFTLGTVISS
jgi:hypothetical protein